MSAMRDNEVNASAEASIAPVADPYKNSESEAIPATLVTSGPSDPLGQPSMASALPETSIEDHSFITAKLREQQPSVRVFPLVAAYRWFRANTVSATWLPGWLRHPLVGSLIAVLLQVLAVGATFLLVRLFPTFSLLGLLEILIIALIALNWGFVPGLVATLAGMILLNVVLLPPYFFWTEPTLENLVEASLFLIVGLTISVVASQTARARRDAEQLSRSLETERTRLEAFVEMVPDVVAVYDARGEIARLNRVGREKAGVHDREYLMPGVPQDYTLYRLTGEPLSVEELPFTRALHGESVYGVEMSYLHGEGDRRYISVNAAPLRDAQDKIEGVIAITHDISNLRRSERQAAERASELEAIFDAMTDGVVVFGLDGEIQRANAAFRELLALPAEDTRFLPRDIWPQERILQDEILKNGTAVDVVLHTFDGRELEVNVSVAPVHGAEGTLIGALCICRDVTERRQLERRTHDALNALLAMAESLVLLPGDTTMEGERQATANEVAQRLAELTCKVLGCQRVSIQTVEPGSEIFRPMAIVGLSPEQEQRWWAQSEEERRLNTVFPPDLVARLRADEVALLDMTKPDFSEMPNSFDIQVALIAPMKLGNQIIGLLTLDYGATTHEYSPDELMLAGAIAKLTSLVIERERLLRERADARANELALRESNRQMEDFLGMVSHELKTPLTSIKGNTQLAVRQLKNSLQVFERIVGLYEGAERQTRRLGRLVDDLLDVSRTQVGQLDILLAPGDIIGVVREAVEEQQQAWPSRTIAFDPPAELLPPLEFDADRIKQVIANYLVNALKYSHEEQPVSVSLKPESAYVRVSVHDMGPGLSLEAQEHIWERFYRAKEVEVRSNARSSTVGLGLGLHISKMIVEQHQGDVGVQSRPDEGATFWFTLPYARPDESANPEEDEDQAS